MFPRAEASRLRANFNLCGDRVVQPAPQRSSSCGATHGQTAQVAETARSVAASRDTVVPCPEHDFGGTKRKLNELGNSSLEDGDITMEMIGHKDPQSTW